MSRAYHRNKSDTNSGIIHFVVLSIYALASGLLYFKSLNNFFISDDFILIFEIFRGDFLVLFWHYPPDFPHFFRPLSIFSYRLLFLLFGYSQNYFLYFNFLLHLVNSFLVYLLSIKIVSAGLNVSGNRNFMISFFAGLLFCVHYIHAEPVLFMAAMSELLFTSFYLLALIFYFRYKAGAINTDKYLVILFFILSLLSKETAISLLLILFAAEKVIFRVSFIKIIKDYSLIFIIGALYVIFRFLFFPKMLEPQLYQTNNILFEAAKNISFTCTALFFSMDFMAIKDFFRTQDTSLVNSLVRTYIQFPFVLIAQVLSIVFYFIMVYKKDKIAVFAFLFIFITVAPTLWLAGFERYLYLPSAGFSVLVVYSLYKLIVKDKREKLFGMTLLGIILIYNITSLSVKTGNWNTASDKSKQIVEQLKLMEEKFPENFTVYFKNLPDNYKGAWVFRNGIEYIPVLFLNRNDLVFKRVDLDYEVQSNKDNKTLLVYYSDGRFEIK
jgi:protein O-mannosyl-transferase